MRISKLNAAVVVLVSRKKVFKITLDLFYRNWNSRFNYPVYVHTFGKIFSSDEKIFFKKKYNNIFFLEIYPQIPDHVKNKDLFYNRFYNDYAYKSFSPLRIGYLHMCYFASNITSFGKRGCISKKLKKYDYIMRIDDDSWFKKKISFDFFKKLKKYPMATGRLTVTKNNYIGLTRENLFEFIKEYTFKNNIKIKNKKLRFILKNNNSAKLNLLQYSLGNLDLYNIKLLKNNNYSSFINKVNKYGGIYKFRWSDYDLINLFLYIFYNKPIYDLKLRKLDYESSHPLAKKISTNPISIRRIFSGLFFRFLFFQIRKRFYKIFC